MRNNTLLYLETATITLTTCLPLHYFADVDWPRAFAIGLVTAIIMRAITHHRRPPKSSRPQT
jgi:hypothetical protein